MTQRQFKRLRQWETRTQSAFNAGVIDGMDAFYLGYARPEDPDAGYDAPFDLRFCIWPNDRLEQYYRNSQLARMRGMCDGFDQAEQNQKDADREDYIEREVLDGIEDIENFLRTRRAA